jgi:hypothetical protein
VVLFSVFLVTVVVLFLFPTMVVVFTRGHVRGFYFSVQCVVERVLPVLQVLFLAGYMGAFLSPLLFRGAFFLRWCVEQLLRFMS